MEPAAAAARAASPRWFARWTDNILSGKVKPQGKSARVGKMSLKVKAFLKTKGIDADTTAIHVIDKRIRRMLRTGKPTPKQLPADFIRRMPEMLRKPKAVLWDKRKRNLVYVFDVPSDAKKGKFLVNVEFTQEVQRGDKLVLRKGNFVASGGQVPAINLKDRAVFELVEGRL